MHSSFAIVVTALAASTSAWGVRGVPYGALRPSGSAVSGVSPSGYAPHTGVRPTEGYPMPTGEGPYKPSGSGYFPKPPTTGEFPKGSDVGPIGTGAPTAPFGSGIPGKSPPGVTSPAGITTTTVYGSGTTTVTSTSIGTTTSVSTITTFVPCSTPIATAGKSTYYSTFLTVSYATTTVTSTVTKVSVICPSTAAAGQASDYPGASTTGSKSPVNGNTYGAGSGSSAAQNDATPGAKEYSSTSSNSPVNGNGANGQSYKPTTVFGAASAPTSGTCAPAQTVYSTVVVSVTAGGSSCVVPNGPTAAPSAGDAYAYGRKVYL